MTYNDVLCTQEEREKRARTIKKTEVFQYAFSLEFLFFSFILGVRGGGGGGG